MKLLTAIVAASLFVMPSIALAQPTSETLPVPVISVPGERTSEKVWIGTAGPAQTDWNLQLDAKMLDKAFEKVTALQKRSSSKPMSRKQFEQTVRTKATRKLNQVINPAGAEAAKIKVEVEVEITCCPLAVEVTITISW